VRLAAGATLSLAVLAVPVAAVASGSSGAVGAAIGVGMVVVFFGFGAMTVGAVAAVSPSASLLVALMTYVLQVAAIGVVFVALRDSGALGATVHAGWVGGSVIGATTIWLVAQTVSVTRSRQPLYDLPTSHPDARRDGPEASAP
jgi:ATP synthase protein I